MAGRINHRFERLSADRAIVARGGAGRLCVWRAAIAVVMSAAAAASGQTPAGGGAQADPTVDQLKAKIEALSQRVEELERQQSAARALPTTADVDEAVRRVVADAEERSRLLPRGGDLSIAWDEHLVIKTADGAFSLQPIAVFQFRHVTNFDDNGSDIEDGFEIRRLKLGLRGTALSPELSYHFQIANNPNSATMTLEYANVTWKWDPNWAVTAGLFKLNVFHEEFMIEQKQLAPERSLTNELIGGGNTGRTEGVSLAYGPYNPENPWSIRLTLDDGDRQSSTDFRDTTMGSFGAALRGEYKVFGEWKNYEDFTAKGTRQPLLVIGAAGDVTQGDDTTFSRATVDAQYETSGRWGIYAAALFNYTDGNEDGPDDTFNYGGLGQVAYLVNDHVELFSRVGWSVFDRDQANGEDQIPEIGVGGNYYVGQAGKYLHRGKFTVDVTYLPAGSPIQSVGSNTVVGDDAQFILRAQFQLWL